MNTGGSDGPNYSSKHVKDTCALLTKSKVAERVRVCCNVLQRVIVCSSGLTTSKVAERLRLCCSVLQRVAACCSVLQRVAACCSVLLCV